MLGCRVFDVDWGVDSGDEGSFLPSKVFIYKGVAEEGIADCLSDELRFGVNHFGYEKVEGGASNGA